MRISNVDTLSSLLDRLITENIKLFFFEKRGNTQSAIHQQTIIKGIRQRISELFTESNEHGYEYVSEHRTFSNNFLDDVQNLVLNDIRIGEADRARLESAESDPPDFYRLAFNEIRLRIANEGRAKNKNAIDDDFKNIMDV